MAQPAIAGEGSFLVHLPAASPNACFQCNRSTAGSPLAQRPRNEWAVIQKGESRLKAAAARIGRPTAASHFKDSTLAPAVDLTPAQVVHCLPPGVWEPALLNHRTGPI